VGRDCPSFDQGYRHLAFQKDLAACEKYKTKMQ
jgi:hypothetical protein